MYGHYFRPTLKVSYQISRLEAMREEQLSRETASPIKVVAAGDLPEDAPLISLPRHRKKAV